MTWLAKVKRRRGGVYLWRVDHHVHRFRRVNGYVGETVSFHFRSRQHMGSSHYVDGLKARQSQAMSVGGATWNDMNPKMYKVISLPWWLCWKWVLRPLETLVILCTWPIYNDAKNRWNPRRIDRKTAQMNRAARDAGSPLAQAGVWVAHAFRVVSLSAILLTFAIVAYRYGGVFR